MSDFLEDTKTAERSFLLPMVMKNIQLDINNIKNSPFKIKEPYIDLLENMHTLASYELRDIKKLMWDRKVKVVNVGKREMFTDYIFYINGLEMPKSYNNHMIKKYVKEILEELIKKEGESRSLSNNNM